jgi:capsule polysaccharide export protein KpsE/RkpR
MKWLQFWKHTWKNERTFVMSQLTDLRDRLTALTANLATVAANLQGDVANLKAEIEALRAQITDPAVLAALDAAVTNLETTLGTLQVLDQATPPIPPPGPPA